MNSAPIIAKRFSTKTIPYTHIQPDLAMRGIVAVWELTSPRARQGVMVYEYAGPRYQYVWGSRALYGRWLRQWTAQQG